MDRRFLLSAIPAFALLPRPGQAADFTTFLGTLQARAAAAGIPQSIILETTGSLVPNADVIRLDQHQPEFTLTWAQFSARVLSATRIAAGRQKAASARNLLAAVTSRYGVAAGALLGIWGCETNYGTVQGNFDVIDALTTLAWNRNSEFFASEVIAAMRIVAAGDAPAAQLIGSYAGAMGQPQFMPSVYLSTAVSFAGTGRPDIWTSDADTLASIAHYLAKAGWRPGEPSSEPVLVADGIDMSGTGRTFVRTIRYWEAHGVQRLPGAPRLAETMPAALLLPDGAGGQAFLIYENFRVIRRYNPSDYYALAVGALGRLALS